MFMASPLVFSNFACAGQSKIRVRAFKSGSLPRFGAWNPQKTSQNPVFTPRAVPAAGIFA
jgi:hypothetical protein